MKTLARLAVVAIAYFSLAIPPANAEFITTIVGDMGDGQVSADGSISGVPLEFDRVGAGGDNLRGFALIYFFELPTFSLGTTITNAQVELEYLGISPATITTIPEFNADLFGIDARPTAIMQSADYYDGDSSFSSDSLILNSFITPTTTPGNLSVSNLNLLSFVESLYNLDGTPTSSFAAFRLNPDKDLPVGSGPIRGFDMALADHATLSFRPRLELTTEVVPEPSSIVLLGIGCVALCGYGWLKRKPA